MYVYIMCMCVCVCTHVHIYIYTHTYISPQSIYCYLCVCLQCWPFGIGRPSGMLFPQEDYSFSEFLSDLLFVLGWGHPSFSLFTSACLSVSALFRSWWGNHVGENLWTLCLIFLGDTILLQTPCVSGSYSFSAPLLRSLFFYRLNFIGT